MFRAVNILNYLASQGNTAAIAALKQIDTKALAFTIPHEWTDFSYISKTVSGPEDSMYMKEAYYRAVAGLFKAQHPNLGSLVWRVYRISPRIFRDTITDQYFIPLFKRGDQTALYYLARYAEGAIRSEGALHISPLKERTLPDGRTRRSPDYMSSDQKVIEKRQELQVLTKLAGLIRNPSPRKTQSEIASGAYLKELEFKEALQAVKEWDVKTIQKIADAFKGSSLSAKDKENIIWLLEKAGHPNLAILTGTGQ